MQRPTITVLLVHAWLAAALGGCSLFDSGLPLAGDIVAQARPPGQIAFDVVKVDDAVIATLRDRAQDRLQDRFKKYEGKPELKMAVGDTVVVAILEPPGGGLFGAGLPDLGGSGTAFGSTGEGAGGSATGQTPLAGQGPSFGQSPLSEQNGLGFNAPGQNAPGQAGQASPLGGGSGNLGETAEGLGEALGSGLGQALPGNLGEALGGSSGTALPGAPSPFGGGAGNVAGGNPSAGAGGGFGGPGFGAARSGAQLLGPAGQSTASGARLPEQQVGPNGAISVPYAGRIKVVGRTTAEVERAIAQKLAGKALQPQVLVVVTRSAANSVTVSGEVVNGGRVPLTADGQRLLQVIAAAGGARAPVHDVFVSLSRDGVTATVPLETLVADPAEDIYARPGDVLTLRRSARSFSVFGATGRNAAVPFGAEKLNLSEALAKAGGLLDERANPKGVFLFRYEPAAIVRALGQPLASDARDGISPVVYRFDLSDPKAYLLAREFPVRSRDVIFVADADIKPVYNAVTVLSNIVGPVETGLLTCQGAKC
ncbi:MAG: polysaccharide export protein [Alphaproteobacteria bacterium]|nr:polysaccharide export protein [Alphaproteobacteria bacterium]